MAGKMVDTRGVRHKIAAERAIDPKLAAYLLEAERLRRDYDRDGERYLFWWVRRRLATARRAAIEANLLLTVKIAAVYAGQGMPLIDLIGYGNIGLIMAVDAYDPSGRARFGTYASWKVRAAVSRSLVDKGTTIRISHNIVALRRRLWTLEGEALTYGRALEDGEAAEALAATPKAIRKARHAQDRPLSLDLEMARRSSAKDGEHLSLADVIADPSPSLEDTAISLMDMPGMRNRLRRGLATLTPRERKVIELRYFSGQSVPHEDVAREIGVTRERARQIEKETLVKLRGVLDPDFARPVKAG